MRNFSLLHVSLFLLGGRMPAEDPPKKPPLKIIPGKVIVPTDAMRRPWGELLSLDFKTRTGTFRNESKYLAGVYQGDPTAEYLAFFRAGIDGVFTDFANTGFAARAAYLTETGR